MCNMTMVMYFSYTSCEWKTAIRAKLLGQGLRGKLYGCYLAFAAVSTAFLRLYSFRRIFSGARLPHLPIWWARASSGLVALCSDLVWCAGLHGLPSRITEPLFSPLKNYPCRTSVVCLILWTCLRFMITISLLYRLTEVAWCSSEYLTLTFWGPIILSLETGGKVILAWLPGLFKRRQRSFPLWPCRTLGLEM